MTVEYSEAVRDAKNDQVETTIGPAPKLQFFTGAKPADCATADSGTMLVDSALPSDWLGNSSAGVKSKSGTWSLTGIAAGTIGHYRVKDSTGATCHEQGSVTITGAGGDM